MFKVVVKFMSVYFNKMRCEAFKHHGQYERQHSSTKTSWSGLPAIVVKHCAVTKSNHDYLSKLNRRGSKLPHLVLQKIQRLLASLWNTYWISDASHNFQYTFTIELNQFLCLFCSFRNWTTAGAHFTFFTNWECNINVTLTAQKILCFFIKIWGPSIAWNSFCTQGNRHGCCPDSAVLSDTVCRALLTRIKSFWQKWKQSAPRPYFLPVVVTSHSRINSGESNWSKYRNYPVCFAKWFWVESCFGLSIHLPS